MGKYIPLTDPLEKTDLINPLTSEFHEDEEFKDLILPGECTNQLPLQISNYGKVYNPYLNKYYDYLINTTGYVYLLYKSEKYLVHRLVAATFVPGYMNNGRDCVNHIDGCKSNNYYKNLEWCTKAENNKHAYATNLNQTVGENCHSAKLTNELARKVCELLQDGYEIWDVLDAIGFERTMNNYEIIRSIRKGYAWRSISKDYNVGYTEYPRSYFPPETVKEICQCFQDGLSVREAIMKLFDVEYNSHEYENYRCRFENIRNRKMYGSISKDYKF